MLSTRKTNPVGPNLPFAFNPLSAYFKDDSWKPSEDFRESWAGSGVEEEG